MPVAISTLSDDELVRLLTRESSLPPRAEDELILRGHERLGPKLVAIFTAPDWFTRKDVTRRAMVLYLRFGAPDTVDRLLVLAAKVAERRDEAMGEVVQTLLASLGEAAFGSLEAAATSPIRPVSVRILAIAVLEELGVAHASIQKNVVRLFHRLINDARENLSVRNAAAIGLESFMAEVHPVVATPQAGRNDPCPCGSGRKFKKCCEFKDAPPVPKPPAVSPEELALRQTAPFALDNPRLAEHPQIVEWQGRAFTPRIASAMPFIIKLNSAEMSSQQLIVGHRFLPFQKHDARVRLRLPNGVETGPSGGYLSSQAIQPACAMLPRSEAAQLIALPLELARKGEFVVQCVDFDRGLYEVLRSTPPGVPHEQVQAALADVVATPPPGPVFATRQLLHVVARCFDPSKAIGPLASILGATPGVRLRQGESLALFVPHVKGDLRAELDDFVATSRWSDGLVKQIGWDPVTLTFIAVVHPHYGKYEARLTLTDPIQPSCVCYDKRCGHTRAAAERLIELLNADEPLAKQIKADLAKPAWRRGIESIDETLKRIQPKEVPTSRLTWRITIEERTFRVTPYLQKQTSTGKWSAGRQLDGVSTNAPWATAADVDYARTGKLASLAGHPLVFLDERPARIERAPLRLRIERTQGLRLTIEAGGLTKSLHTREEFIFVDLDAARFVVGQATPAQRTAVLELIRIPELPPEAEAELMARIPAVERVVPVELPDDLAGEKVDVDRRPRLRLTPRDAGIDAAMRMVLLHDAVPGVGATRLFGAIGGRRVFVERALDAERAAAAGVAESLGLQAPPWEWRIDSDDAALDLIAKLESRDDVVVESPVTLTRPATEKDLRVDIAQEHDWFGLDGEVAFDGESVPLKLVLEAMRAGRRYVRIKGAKWLRIADLFRDRLRQLADVVQGPSGLQVGTAAAPVVQELVREAGTLKACEAWSKLETRLEAARNLSPDPPASFAAELRDYQLDGYRWLRRLAAWGVGGCLADDMGLGKTVQALAVLVDRAAEGPALVACPTSVASNWIRECRRFAPTLNPVLYRETRDVNVKAGDVVVISYGLVLRDAEPLAKVAWGTMILDEAQFLKNSQSKTAAAVRTIPAGWRLAMTGTPIENHLGELWSLFRAISPGVFGSWERFRERFAAPIERDRDASRRAALSRVVRPFILRRTKAEVLSELPARTEMRLEATLSTEEKQLYDAERLAAVASFAGSQDPDARFKVLAALTRLRQIACHPKLVNESWTGGSSKLDVFLETVDELREGRHRALVFSQFTSYLAIVRAALDQRGVKYQYLDGSTPAKDRDAAVDAFQRGEGDLFLISLRAGGTGLNLTAADYVIHLDPWWNPAVEDQATDRAHRIGQTRPVTVYRIVAAGTIEEKILTLHGSKRELVAGVLDGTGAAAKLSVEEMVELMKG